MAPFLVYCPLLGRPTTPHPLIQTTRGARPCDGHQPASSRWFFRA